jgi:hypothetical protein
MAIENIMKGAHLQLPSAMAVIITTCYSFPAHPSFKQIGTRGIERRVILERIFKPPSRYMGR